MFRYRIARFLLILGVVFGFGSGFAHLAWAHRHGGCHGGGAAWHDAPDGAGWREGARGPDGSPYVTRAELAEALAGLASRAAATQPAAQTPAQAPTVITIPFAVPVPQYLPQPVAPAPVAAPAAAAAAPTPPAAP